MEQINTLEDALKEELRDLFSAETQIVKALPKIIKRASSGSLKEGLKKHLQETEEQVRRLDQIAKKMQFKIAGKTCQGMKGLLTEGEEVLKEKGEPSLIDALIIGACQRVEHYEMAGYAAARAMCEALGETEIAEILQETLDEEGQADRKLTEVAESEVLPECAGSMEEESDEAEEGEEEEEDRPSKKGSRRDENRGMNHSR